MVQIVYGLCLIVLGLLWSRSRPIVFFGIVFLFFLITKGFLLNYPFYGDAIGGPFVEAWWLAHNNFNYAELFQQPSYSEGGLRFIFCRYIL